MTPKELKEKLGNGDDILLIDVRGEEEFKSGFCIPGSENIPMGGVAAEIFERGVPQNKKIVLVCKTGNRSGLVCEELRNLGYDAESLDGGIMSWKD